MPYRKSKSWGELKPPPGTAIDWGHPFNKGLTALWLFNEGGGKILRDATGRYPGTLNPAPAWTVGKFGDALLFDGATTYVPISTPFILNTTIAWTVAAWAYPTAVTGDYTIFSEAFNGGNFTQLALLDIPDSTSWRVQVRISGVDFTCKSSSNPAPVANEWAFVAGTYNANESSGTLKLYVNGKLSNSLTGVGSLAGGTEAVAMNIGCYQGPVNLWPGKIENMRVYLRALTSSEILNLYNFPFGGMLAPRRRIISQGAGGVAPETFGFYRRRVG